MKHLLERFFKLEEHRTNVRRELMAGFITFLTMSYILVVNPDILSNAGMDKEALFTSTCVVTIISTLLMGLYARLPIAQAPGMGLNAFFAFTICGVMGYSWQFALTAVFIEGIIFILLTLFKVRELIVQSIPSVLKDAIPVGIGLFLSLIGLTNAGIVVSNPSTFLALGDLSSHSVWIAMFGLLVTVVLYVLKVRSAILIGIVAATLFGALTGDVHFPSGNIVGIPPSLAPLVFQFDTTHIFSFDMLFIVFTLLFVNLFDTVGTLIGMMKRADLVDDGSHHLRFKQALMSDSVGTTLAGVLGTSTVTAYVESAAGVAAGGRTGLTAVSTALFFVLSLFFAPLFLIVPSAAAAPALIVVGLFMLEPITKIDFSDMSVALPAFLTIIFMPFTYSIAEGIVFGLLSYLFIRVFTGKALEVPLAIYIIDVLFVIKMVVDSYH
ncbi:MAG: NCS2 family permease [Prevotellaceae bacterium]|jgi:AGZA family xanthine/uracil permease-like MFS transporter|nr:NCS2 family permease [Prevotellaceae bacterium]